MVFAKTFHITLSLHRSEKRPQKPGFVVGSTMSWCKKLQCSECVKNIKSEKFITYRKSSHHNLSRMLKSRKIGMLKTTCITVMYTCIKIGLCNTSVTFREKQKYALQILI